MLAVRGRLAQAKADTKPLIRNWEPSKISSTLLSRAKQLGLEVALDLAYQCAPDHPYVKEHKEWFRLRPDGSVQYAENPPKKYQDIFPIDFETERWPGPLGRAEKRGSVTGSSRAFASSASIIRTPSRSTSGSG